MRLSVALLLAVAVVALSGALSTASADDKKDQALQLVQQAFACKTAVTTTATARSADEIEWRGDYKKFSVFFQRTSAETAADSAAYGFRGGTYISFLSLLSFTPAGKRLTVSCKQPACLAHAYVDSGCDENGICANISVNSQRKEYIDSFYIDLCDASAAKDAADGLAFISQSN